MFRRLMSRPAQPEPDSPLEPPEPPKAERLNRNVLTIAAVLMGVLVLAAVVFTQPPSAAHGDSSSQPPPAITVPGNTFLDEPARGAGGFANGASLRDSLARRLPPAPLPDPASAAADAEMVYAAGADHAAAAEAAGLLAPPPRDRRTDAYEAALEAPVLASTYRAERSAGGSLASSVDGGAATGEQRRPAPEQSDPAGSDDAIAAARAYGAAFRPPPADGRSRPERFMADVARERPEWTVRTSFDPPPGPFTLQTGTLISGVLITEINSDLPGDILAQVARDVYDSETQRTLLLPSGSKLLGKYDNQVTAGQNRLLVAWTRVILPDGRSITLPGLPVKDRVGAGGMRDQVDRHAGQVFGTATLLSLISAGAQLSQPNGGYSTAGGYPSPGQITAGAVGQQLAEVASQMLRRNIDIPATIRIRAGMPFNVFLNADLTFPGPYPQP